jgi:RNA polymerase sigma-70 factor (ECF subfamily)
MRAEAQTLAELLPDLRRRASKFVGGDAAAAEDLVQETALRAHRFADSFQPGTCYRAWLFSIMRNRFISGYRRRQRERVILDQIRTEDRAFEHSTTDATSETPVDVTAVVQALARLPEPHKSVLTLLARGLTYPAIADTLGCPIGTVQSRIHRARIVAARRLSHLREDTT